MGVKSRKDMTFSDPNGVIERCWDVAGKRVQRLQKFIQQKDMGKRSRVLVEFDAQTQEYVIKELSEIFERLKKIKIGKSFVTRVAASKVLFATIPEIAIPIDKAEWDYVFETEKYEAILTIMINEIKEWEIKTEEKLESVDNKKPTTLPSIYNVMAMSARPS